GDMSKEIDRTNRTRVDRARDVLELADGRRPARRGSDGACPAVRDALRDDVYDARHGLAVLGVEHPADHLEPGDHVFLDVEGGPVALGGVDGYAVDEVGHLAFPPASEVAIDDAGLKVEDLVDV